MRFLQGYSFMLCPSFFLALEKKNGMDYNKDKWKNKEEFFMSMTLLWALICLIIFGPGGTAGKGHGSKRYLRSVE